MEAQTITLDRQEAKRLYREYKKHQHYSTPIDQEVQRAYKLIAAGKVVIRALESVRMAGLNAEGLPKLAIAPADAVSTECRMERDGGCKMDARAPNASYRGIGDNIVATRAFFSWPRGSFAATKEHWRATSLVPGIPLHLRPKRGLPNYHILWEAEWTKIPPRDPFLLRRIGKADLWLVVAAWDLTEVERAALATRITQ